MSKYWYLVPAVVLIGVVAAVVHLGPGQPRVLPALPAPGVNRTVPICNLTTSSPAWTAHVIYDDLVGADGVEVADPDGDGDQDLVVPVEQAGDVIICPNPGAGAVRSAGEWGCATLDASLSSVEGAAWGDWDSDGRLDVCAAGQAGNARIYFGPASNGDVFTPGAYTQMTLTNAEGLNSGWMQCSAVSFDAANGNDVLLGGTAGTADGRLSWLAQPASGKRTGANWTRTDIVASLGRVMSAAGRDLDGDADFDVIYSNRATPGTVGLVWMECTNAGCTTWTAHTIDSGAGGPRMMFTPGDTDADGDVLDLFTGFDGAWLARRYTYVGNQKWVVTLVPNPGTVGVFQAGAFADLDRDGYPDLVASFSSATTGLSGLVWLRGGYTPKWARGEIAGLAGATVQKYDNFVILDLDGDQDLDVIATDQGNETSSARGVLWFENPCN